MKITEQSFLFSLLISAVLSASQSAVANEQWVLKDRHFSLSRSLFDETLEARGFDVQQLSHKQGQALLRELFIRETLLKQQDKVPTERLAVLDKQLADYRKTQLAKLTLDSLSESEMPDYSERAREIYEARKERDYLLPLKLRVRVLSKRISTENKDEIIEQLQTLRGQLVSGELDFRQAVLAHSDDPKKKLTEGDSFWFSREQKPSSFFKVADGLTDEQPVSDVFFDQNSAYLIYFMGRQNPIQRPFAEVKDSIVSELQDDYRNQQRSLLLGELRERFQSQVEINPGVLKGE